MQRLVTALDAAKSTRSRKAKVTELASLMASLEGEELAFTARLILGSLLAPGDARVIGVGWRLLGAAAAKIIGITEAELGLRVRELGDFGDTLEALMPEHPSRLALSEVPKLVDALAETPDRQTKLQLLDILFSKASPAEAKYLGKALLGELRIGVQRGLFEEGLAKAFASPLEVLRRAAALVVDPGQLALLAKSKLLESAEPRVGHVVASMLATPTETVKEPIELALTVAEDKLDGIRTQAHVNGFTVRLFGRGQDDITDSFPDVVRALRGLPRPAVLDGEIIAITSQGKVRPFQALQARLGRVSPSEKITGGTPVQFVAFDVLFDGHSLLSQPWSERRKRLDALPVIINPFTRLDPALPLDAQLETLFVAARGRGHEGLMLKRIDSLYEAGRRGSAWRKMKRPFGTLDCVITMAERGHGKRAAVLSDYTFAVWQGDELVDIGKAYSGLTDAEIADLTTRLEALTIEKRPGGAHRVTPSVVLEIAFDGLQPSKRHPSGFAMRFPRILRIRDDKKPEEADRLETARALFDAQVDTGHRETAPQLDLFGPPRP